MIEKIVLNNKFFQKKYFSQIFLKNTNVINDIIVSICPKKNDLLFEIGPGLGALTIPLCGFVNKLNVIDIDNDVINFFKRKNIYNKLNFYLKNVLHFDFLKFYLKNNKQSIRIFGNLPYNISTKLLIYLTNNHFIFKDLHLMFQKEVAERILAGPHTKFYGRLSIISQYFFKINKIFDISKNCFFPIPKVNSSFLKFIPHKLFPYLLFDINILSKITFEAFNKRRKILRHGLKKFFTEKDLFNLDIDPQLRPENLSVKQYCLLTDFLIKKKIY